MKRARLCKLISTCIPLSKINFEVEEKKIESITVRLEESATLCETFLSFIHLLLRFFLKSMEMRLYNGLANVGTLFSILSSNNRSPFLTIILSQSGVSDSQINYNQILPSSFFPSSYLYVFFILLSI